MADTSAPGELLMRGLSGFGEGIANGINQYIANKKSDAVATGQIEAFMQSAGSAGLPPLSDRGQSAVQKFLDGNLTLPGKLALLGELQTARVAKQQDIERQQQQLQLQAMQRQQAIINSYLGGQGAPQAPSMAPNANGVTPYITPGPMAGGRPVPNAQVQPQQGPLGNYIGQMVQATGALPTPEMMNNYVNRTMGVEKPIGYVYNGPKFDSTTGKAIGDEYHLVYQRADGNIRRDDAATVTPFGKTPGTVLDPRTFQPTPGGQVQTPGAAGNAPANTGDLPSIPTKEQQEALKSANDEIAGLQQNQVAIANLKNAANKYISDNPAGNRTNPIMGTEPMLKVRSALFGQTSGQTMEGASSNLVNVVLAPWKNAAGGSRLSQNEFNILTNAMPKPDDPNYTIIAKINYMDQIQSMMMARAQSYRDYIAKGMAPGDAAQAATKALPFVKPPDFNESAVKLAPAGTWTPEKARRMQELLKKSQKSQD